MALRWLSDLRGTLSNLLSIGRATLDASALSASRSYTLPDSSGTLALTSQLGASVSIFEATVDFGSGNGLMEKTFDVTVTGAATSQKAIAFPSLSTVAGIAEDELEMDMLACAARVSATNTVRVTVASLRGPIQGQRKINIVLGA